MNTLYSFAIDEFVEFSFADILEMLDLDTDVLQAFTPALLRAWLRAHNRAYRVEMKCMLHAAWAAVVGHSEAMKRDGHFLVEQVREGFAKAVHDHVWLETLVEIAGASMFNDWDLQEMEAGFPREKAAKLRAEREMAAQFRKERLATEDEREQVADKAPIPTREPVRAAVVAEEFDLEDMPTANDLLVDGEEQVAKRAPEADLYLPAARTTQLTLPHIVMRSPIIALKPRNAARPVFTDDHPLRIARVSGMRSGTVDMTYVGEELRASDWETFAYILRFAATVPLGARLPSIRVVEMLKAMGRGTSTPDREKLTKQLQRLRNAELRVWTNDVAVVESWQALFPQEKLFNRGDIPGVRTSFKLLGDLVEAKTENGNTIEFSTELSRYVRVFFGQKLSTWYSESMYQQLTGDLAKRLFLFYQSHDGRFDFTFDEMVEYLGTSTDRKQFVRSLAKAHDELTAACFFKGWSLKASARRNGQKAYVLAGLTVEKKTKVDDEEHDLN